jgi:hypothetical protein
MAQGITERMEIMEPQLFGEQFHVMLIRIKAAWLGRNYGEILGNWVIDPFTTQEQCMRLIEGYENSDPEIMQLCPSPLSGEFADGPTVYSVLKELGADPAVPESWHDEVIDAYEDAFEKAWWTAVLDGAHIRHGGFEPCGVCKHYGHKAKEHDE